jgi:hypothetical protein
MNLSSISSSSSTSTRTLVSTMTTHSFPRRRRINSSVRHLTVARPRARSKRSRRRNRAARILARFTDYDPSLFVHIEVDRGARSKIQNIAYLLGNGDLTLGGKNSAHAGFLIWVLPYANSNSLIGARLARGTQTPVLRSQWPHRSFAGAPRMVLAVQPSAAAICARAG